MTSLKPARLRGFSGARMCNRFNQFQAGANRSTIHLNQLLGRIDELAGWEQQTRWVIEPAEKQTPLENYNAEPSFKFRADCKRDCRRHGAVRWKRFCGWP